MVNVIEARAEPRAQEASTANVELRAIYEISRILGSSLDLKATLSEVLTLLASYMEMLRGQISIVDESGELRLIVAHGLTGAQLAAFRWRDGEGITPGVFRTGVGTVVPDITEEPRFLNQNSTRVPAPGKVIAFIAVPIRCNRQTRGVLSVDREGPVRRHSFQSDLQFLQMVGNLIGQTVKLAQTVQAERAQLLSETHRLKKELATRYRIDNVVGSSKVMQEVFAEVHQAAPGRTSVLLRGESGTGKEVIARALHYLSPRRDAPFIKVNCAALTETLLESELFGHERGAFTGAVGERKGRFEQAHGGTLFLDEIGDVSPAFQAKLLRVLQEREFERVGGNRTVKVDVRLVCATNRDLEQAVADGEFRADLYYRINVVPIFLPPLRERREDIPKLVEFFLDRFNEDNGRRLAIAPAALRVLQECYWPGNVRELQNCVERAATMTRGDAIRDLDFPCLADRCLTRVLHKAVDVPVRHPVPIPVRAAPVEPAVAGRPGAGAPVPVRSAPAPEPGRDVDGPVDYGLAPFEPAGERERLVRAMEQCGWVQAKAARLLNLTPRQVGYALHKHGIPIKRL